MPRPPSSYLKKCLAPPSSYLKKSLAPLPIRKSDLMTDLLYEVYNLAYVVLFQHSPLHYPHTWFIYKYYIINTGGMGGGGMGIPNVYGYWHGLRGYPEISWNWLHYIWMCPNWGDHEDRRETQGLGTIIYFGMNGFIATNIFFMEVSLNPHDISTNQMMLPNRILSYQATLQNCHEFK